MSYYIFTEHGNTFFRFSGRNFHEFVTKFKGALSVSGKEGK